MKKQLLFTIPVLCLVTTLLCVLSVAFAQKRSSNATKRQGTEIQSVDYRISGPYTHKNLTVFLVHGKDLISGHNFITLQEALAQKKVIVYETKDVNELAIKNLSNQDIYVQAGDIVRGGDQDRMISTDFIVPPTPAACRSPRSVLSPADGISDKAGVRLICQFGQQRRHQRASNSQLRCEFPAGRVENVSVAQRSSREERGRDCSFRRIRVESGTVSRELQGEGDNRVIHQRAFRSPP